jgi:hypothetical protein
MKRILLAVIGLLPLVAGAQNWEKVVFDKADSVNGYYLAVRPLSGVITGVVVVFTWYGGPERIPPETKLHNVAAVNNLLTIYASTGIRVSPGAAMMDRMNRLFAHVIAQYGVDSSSFALGGADCAGMAILRYTELAHEHPGQYVIHPRVVFGISAAVDLAAVYRQSEREIRKNYPNGPLDDAKAVMNLFNKEMGSLADHAGDYARWTPFDHTIDGPPGNERFLQHVAVRLYYDNEIEWRLQARRDSYYDTYMPDGSELIDQLLLLGNNRAEYVAAKGPGIRSNGNRSAGAYNIVDEVDCIQWIKKELRPYRFNMPDGWRGEPYPFPPPFAPKVTLKGIEDLHLPPGWGVAGSPEYWCASYLLWLDAGQKIDAAVLQENIRSYYEGLVVNGGGPVKHQIPADKMVPTTVAVREIKAESDDVHTYAGTLDMLDYMAMKPMRLNILAHIKDCGDPGHTPVFLEISPKPYDDEIWYQLKQSKKQFSCQ